MKPEIVLANQLGRMARSREAHGNFANRQLDSVEGRDVNKSVEEYSVPVRTYIFVCEF